MSTATLEKISLEREQVPIRRDTRQELGVSACAGCPFLQRCPGKQEVAQACPPEAKMIAAEQVSSALFDDTIGTILPMSGGGFAVLPEKASMFQTAVLNPQVKLKPLGKKKPPVEAEKSPKSERRSRDKKLGLLATRGERQVRESKMDLVSAVLGALVLIFLGSTASEVAKK